MMAVRQKKPRFLPAATSLPEPQHEENSVPREITEDRTTPQRRPEGVEPDRLLTAVAAEAAPEAADAVEGAEADDGAPDRDKPELRPLLLPERDLTVELPRGDARPGAARRLPRRSAAELALKVGTTMHEYRIDGVLGEGGFGITYLATDVHLDAAVAIKEYLPSDIVFRAGDGKVSPTASEHLPRYRQGLESFLVEARTLASFRHRSIVRVARFFEANGTAYMVLEVEKGEPLKTWWPPHKHIGEKALVELLLPLLDGLSAVHEAGFLHRDIKPDNIQVRSADGSLVLLDFGSASQASGLAPQGLTVVTPGYAPIEQYGLGEQGPWTDIYALGATLYWCVAGKKPPDAETRKADPRAYRRAVDVGRDVFGDAFLKAIDWALNTDPSKRPPTVAALQRALCADHPGAVQRFEATRRRARLRKAAEQAAAGDAAEATPARGRGAPGWRVWLQPSAWPLALKLALAMGAVALLPMAWLASTIVAGSAQALVDAEARHLQSQAERAALELGSFVGEGRRLVHTLAADPAFAAHLAKPSDPQRAALRDRLGRVAGSGSGVQAVALLDAGGTVHIGTETQGSLATGSSQALRPWHLAAQAGQPYTGTLQAGAVVGSTQLYLAEPVRNEQGAVLGAVVVRLDGEPVAQALAGVMADKRLTAFVADGDGVLVQHAHADLRHRSLRPLADERQAQIRADQRFRRDRVDSVNEVALAAALIGAKAPGRLQYDSALTAQPTVAGFAPVPGHDWAVAVTAERAALKVPLLKLQAGLGTGLALVALAVLVAAWLVARSLSQPLRRLHNAMQDLKAGDYEDARLPGNRRDEIGQTMRAFNALSEKLRRQQGGG
jgi:HAMP domain-containing protein